MERRTADLANESIDRTRRAGRRRFDPRTAGTLALCALGLLAWTPTAQAELATRVELDFFEADRDEAVHQATVWIGERNLRIEQRSSSSDEVGRTLIYRGNEGQVFSVTPGEERYVEVERSLLQAFGLGGSGTRNAQRAFDGQLGSLPADQRSGFQRLLGISPGSQKRAALRVERTGETGEAGGMRCEEVRLREGDRLVGEACVADWSRLGLDATDVAFLRDLAQFQRDALRARGVLPIEFIPDQAYDLIAQFDGLPLDFRRHVDGQVRSTIVVRELGSLSSASALFHVPSHFTRRENPLGALAATLLGRSASPAKAGTPAATADGPTEGSTSAKTAASRPAPAAQFTRTPRKREDASTTSAPAAPAPRPAPATRATPAPRPSDAGTPALKDRPRPGEDLRARRQATRNRSAPTRITLFP